MAVPPSEATVSSSPPPSNLPSDSTPIPGLDDQILAIRAEIAKLRAQKSRLSSTLLGSSKIQKCLQARKSHLRNTSTRTLAQNPILNDNGNGSDDGLQRKLEEAIQTQKNENDIKIYRLAYGVTTFPFTDPSPERANEPTLTGVRFDLGGLKRFNASVSGRNENDGDTPDSYFVILRRIKHHEANSSNSGDGDGARGAMTYLKVHHHTIPAHIDLDGLITRYLPLPQELRDAEAMDVDGHERDNGQEETSRLQSESFNDDSGIDVTQDITAAVLHETLNNASHPDPASSHASTQIRGNGQKLHKFIFAVRDDLHSWHYRTQSIAYLREAVGLPPQQWQQKKSDWLAEGAVEEDDDDDNSAESNEEIANTAGEKNSSNSIAVPKYSVSEVMRTTADAYQMRIVWVDDTLGLLKLSYDGFVEKAIVFGVGRHVEGVAGEESEDQNAQHERLFDVERMLMFDKTGGKIHVHHLLDGLKRSEEFFLNA